ncbi:MAG: ABC transporter permease [Clostridiales bacterium]|nr:ABC transporter permease [Clostridiales bacterium]
MGGYPALLRGGPVSGVKDGPPIPGGGMREAYSPTVAANEEQDGSRYLPALTLGTIPLAILTRITRSAMLEVLSQDYVRTARAKGLAERQVILKHALKNALLPVVTIVGLQFGTLLGGAILTETIFSWPGIGSYIYEGILNRDYPVVQAGVLVVATVFVLVNLLVDLSYALLDPRIQYR